MYYQQTPISCGPASLRIAASALGLRPPSEPRVVTMCATTAEGTTEGNLERAAIRLGLLVDDIHARTSIDFIRAVRDSLHAGPAVLIICVDRWQHWVCAIGGLFADDVAVSGNDRYILCDPATAGPHIRKNGIMVLPAKALAKRAYYGRDVKKTEFPYFALRLRRKR